MRDNLFARDCTYCCMAGFKDMDGIKFSCICTPNERVLRAYIAGVNLDPMTGHQRIECVKECVYCDEGSSGREFTGLTDTELANAVLSSWRKYTRDMGFY